MPRICDYEGVDYSGSFWEGKGRDYEDRVERIALQRLLRPGERLLELGAGHARLADLYTGYRQVVLLDYSRSQLERARNRYGLGRYLYVAADVYHLPFAPAQFDVATMVRTLHHMEDPLAALRQVRRVLRRGGTFVLEYTNKRNLKSAAAWLLQPRNWLSRNGRSPAFDPFGLEPVEYYPMYCGFHPGHILDLLRQAGFAPRRRLAVSYFRVPLLKRLVPLGLLVRLDALAQRTGDWWQLSPSGFVRSEAVGADAWGPDGVFWRCPACDGLRLAREETALRCLDCGRSWRTSEGIYDFRLPMAPDRRVSFAAETGW